MFWGILTLFLGKIRGKNSKMEIVEPGTISFYAYV